MARSSLRLAALAACTALLVGACANPSRMDPMPVTATESDPSTAIGFLTQATVEGVLELNASRLAETRAASPAVRTFARHMVESHTAVNEQVVRLGAARGVPMPPMPTPEQRTVMDRLAGLSGEAFDREYARIAGVAAHERSVALYRAAARTQRDTELRTFAQRTLPSLEQHLDAARQLEQTIAAAR